MTQLADDDGADAQPDRAADLVLAQPEPREQPALRADGSVDWSGLPAPATGLRCVVVIPARNEAALLPRALRALARQRGVAGGFEVLVLANNCSDDTAAAARAAAARCSACAIHVVSVAWPAVLAHVGRARRALFDEAASRLHRAAATRAARDGDAGTPRSVMASTDADTCVAPDWLAKTLAAIDAGADAVGGRIVAETPAALPPGALRLMRLDDVYRRLRSRLESLADPDPADPWPRHHQHFGASLAITAEAYAAVGGQPLVPYLEDEALVQALRRHDRPLRHCPAVRVHTSARLDGRAEVGLAWQLRQWANHSADAADAGDASCPPVPHPAAELRLWQLRRQTRDAWQQARAGTASAANLARLCNALRVAAQPPAAHGGPAVRQQRGADQQPLPAARQLLRQLRAADTFGSLWSALEPALRHAVAAAEAGGATLPMDAAVGRLRRLLACARQRPAAHELTAEVHAPRRSAV